MKDRLINSYDMPDHRPKVQDAKFSKSGFAGFIGGVAVTIGAVLLTQIGKHNDRIAAIRRSENGNER